MLDVSDRANVASFMHFFLINLLRHQSEQAFPPFRLSLSISRITTDCHNGPYSLLR